MIPTPNAADLYQAVAPTPYADGTALPLASQSPPLLRFAVGEAYGEGELRYRFVRNDTGVPIPKGFAACWAGTEGPLLGRVVWATGPAAGVALSDIPGRGYGFIQVRGKCGPLTAAQTGSTAFPGCFCSDAAPGVPPGGSLTVNGTTGVFTLAPAANLCLAVNDTGANVNNVPVDGGKTLTLTFE